MTVACLARQLGWSRNYVSMLLHGDRMTPAAQRRVAQALGVDFKRVFPKEGR